MHLEREQMAKMKLIVMTKPTFFVEEDKILVNLFEEGLDNLHLYKPGASPMYSERLLTLLGDDYHNRITVHGHFYLKEEYRLRGIHIDDAFTEAPVGYKGNISRTTMFSYTLFSTVRPMPTRSSRLRWTSYAQPPSRA